MNHNIAICVGHSRPGDSGAVSASGMSEHYFNSTLACRIADGLRDSKIPCMVISRYTGNSYSTAIKWLAEELKTNRATAAVELHFNSAETPDAHGFEYLHWHSSRGGRNLAYNLASAQAESFPKSRYRGLVSIDSTSKRGGLFLKSTHCPAVIAEPFFGSNPTEWNLYNEDLTKTASFFVRGIVNWCLFQQ